MAPWTLERPSWFDAGGVARLSGHLQHLQLLLGLVARGGGTLSIMHIELVDDEDTQWHQTISFVSPWAYHSLVLVKE
jgi:hypothetical protein